MTVKELPVDREPDVEVECDNCGGTIAVWMKNISIDGAPDQCSIEGMVHLQGREEE